MHISVEPGDQFTILHLRGEFDTYYCPLLEKEVQAALDSGSPNLILNLRLVKYINSTALGSILKAGKMVQKAGGKLGISRPSTFVRDILSKIGLDRVLSVYDSDEQAIRGVLGTEEGKNAPAGDGEWKLDPAALIFKPKDAARIDHFLEKAKSENPLHGHAFGTNWAGVGRMASLTPEILSFTWKGGSTGLSAFEMGQLLAVGTEWSVKFRLPLLQRGYCEAQVEIT
ncbi:MAG: STAS domain-containing protein, partial [Planctomycetes bacterium]|nr:STAS domain-containing protein [Planctomycetota bacterium]